MSYFLLCCYLMRGPVPPALLPAEVPAERLFALLEQASGLPVRREEPSLDTVRIAFREADKAQSAGVITLVLRAHGIYVHQVLVGEAPALFASRSARPPAPEVRRLFVEVYAPRHLGPEAIVEAVEKAASEEGVEVVLEPRTGKIVFKGKEEGAVARALERARAIDKPRPLLQRSRLYRCVGMVVREVHAELVRRLPEGVRGRVVLVPVKEANTLLVACGSEDWEVVADLLRKIDPEGEIVERPGPQGKTGK